MLYFFNEINSTQTYIKNNIKSLKHFDGVFTYIQTNGYGRTGKWETSGTQNVHYSFLISKHTFPNNEILYSFISILVKLYLNQQKIDIDIYLPNDFFLNKQKIGGVLIEEFGDNLVIGIGLNFNNKYYYSLNKNIKSLKIFILKLHYFLVVNLKNKNEKYFLESWKKELNIIGKKIVCMNRSTGDNISGTITNLTPELMEIDNISYPLLHIKIKNKGDIF